jgi:hypothetical protein
LELSLGSFMASEVEYLCHFVLLPFCLIQQ